MSPQFSIEPIGGNMFRVLVNQKQAARVHFQLTNIITYRGDKYLVETPYTNDEMKWKIYRIDKVIEPTFKDK